VIPDIIELVAHRGRAVLLDRVVEASETWVRCSVRMRDDFPYMVDGRVPAVVGVELMAQAVAAFAGLSARRAGGRPKVGYLIGVRNLRLRTEAFPAGQELLVSATLTWNDQNLGSFDCSVTSDGAPLADASLTVYEAPPEEPR
jgi:predicted hotdog family 3-hydroxylacyl-ACP dehydratase